MKEDDKDKSRLLEEVEKLIAEGINRTGAGRINVTVNIEKIVITIRN